MEFQQANSHANRQNGDLWMACFQNSADANPVQDGHPHPLLKCLLTQDLTHCPENSAQNSRAYIPTNMSLQPQQGPWNPPTQPVKAHYGSASSGVQYHSVQEHFYQNVNGSRCKPYPTATPREQMVCSRTSTGNIQNTRQNFTQQSFSPVLPSYNEHMAQSFNTTSPSNHHSLHNSSASLQNQQYLHQFNSAPHRGGEANYSVNSNSYMQPLNVATSPQQNQNDYLAEIARITNDLYKSYPIDPKGIKQMHGRSPPTGKQFVSEDKMTSNQTVQTKTLNTATSSNSNPTMHQRYLHGKPEITQHMKNMVPQKAWKPRVAGYEGRETTKKHTISTVNHFGRDASQPMQLPPQRAVTLSTGGNNQNDGSTHSSPGCARAIAVVQPLSQISHQVANDHIINQLDECTATAKSLISGESGISPAVAKQAEHSNGFNRHLQSSNQKWPNIQSAVSGSVSAGPQDVSQKQVAGEQRVPSVPQVSETTEVPEIQNCEKDKSETSTDPEPCDTDLSSVQTTPWTAAKLANLIQDLGKAEVQIQDANATSLTDKLKICFRKQMSQLYQVFKWSITDIANFCKEHVTSDTVILSQVKESFLKQLQNYHILENGEIYSEAPYISSWLNVNEQLDDIDKEFGFSASLNDRLHTCSQSDEVRAATCEMPNKTLPQTELVPADSGEENQDSTVRSTSTCPDEKSSTDSSDPYYSFQITVLPPEEAKSIFEQIHKTSAQSVDIDRQPETVTEHCMEDRLPNKEEVTRSDSEHGHKEVSSIETYCCLEWWIEKLSGSERSVKCNCKKKLSDNDCTEKNPEEEVRMAQNDSKLDVIKLDRDTREKAEENGCKRNMTWSCSALTGDLCIDLAADDDKPEPQPVSIPHSGSVDLVSEEACVQEPLESADVGPARNSDCCQQEFKKVFSSDPASQTSDPERACEQVPPTSTRAAESASDHTAQSRSSTTADLSMSFRLCDEAVGKKRKKKHSHKNTFPFPKKSKMSRGSDPVPKHVECKVSAEATHEPSDPVVKNAQLMLFGSNLQRDNILFGGRTSDELPPKTLSVNLNKTLRHEYRVATPEYSAKQMVHDAWRRSYLPTKINISGKIKLIKLAPCPGVFSYKSDHNTTSEMRIGKRKHKHHRRLKKRQRLTNKAKRVEEKMTEDVAPLKRPDQQRSGHGNRSKFYIPLKNSPSSQAAQRVIGRHK